MDKPPWKIEGFVTAAGRPIVQEWFWDETDIDERDALRDRLRYLVNLEKSQWTEPHFKWFGDIGEIRKSVPRGALRVYGYFEENRRVFVLLHGVVKNKTKDTEGTDLARKRLKRLANGDGTTNELDREERVAGANPTEPEGEGSVGGVEPFGGNRLSD